MGKCKTYRADNLKEAFLQVKLDLGENAKIADTREVKEGFLGLFGGTKVEVDAWVPDNGSSPEDFSGNGSVDASNSSSATSVRGDRHEWILNEDNKPQFSARDHAIRMINQKTGKEKSDSDSTYSKNMPYKNKSNSPAESKSPLNEGDVNNDIAGLVDKTDLLQEKIDALTEKIETDSKDTESAPDYPGYLSDLYVDFVEQGMQNKLARRLIGRLRRILEPHEIDQPAVVRERVREVMEDDFQTAGSIQSKSSPLVLPFIGPTGVGKTTTLAKLAAQKLLEDKKVGFISLDIYRLAAVDQLRCYADILDVPMLDIENYDEFPSAVNELERQGTELIFVDTAGHSQFDEKKLENLEGLFEGDFDCISHLVLSATARQKEMESVLQGFEKIGYDRLIVTKLDETRNYGLLYNLVKQANKPISHLTDGQDVPNDLLIADSQSVTDYLLEGDV